MVTVGIKLPTSIDVTDNSVLMVKYFGSYMIASGIHRLHHSN